MGVGVGTVAPEGVENSLLQLFTFRNVTLIVLLTIINFFVYTLVSIRLIRTGTQIGTHRMQVVVVVYQCRCLWWGML